MIGKNSGEGEMDRVMAIESFTPASTLDVLSPGGYENISETCWAASIVIVSYNSRSHLERCLRSVFATMDRTCEVIVVDNASRDGSADFVAMRFPRVILVHSERNLGFAAGSNLGARYARGRYIVGLNPDTEVTPGWLDALLAPLEGAERQQTNVGITTARVLVMDRRDEVNTCGNITHISGITTCRGLGRPAGAHEFAQTSEVPAISGACFALTRSLWTQLGGFDETYFTYLEDTDMSLRARLLGYTCMYTPNAVVYHSYTGSFSALKLYYLERNRLMMLLKLYRTSTLIFMLPALALTEIITWAYAIKNGKGHIKAKRQAYAWLISHRTDVMSKRAEMQVSRQESDLTLLNIVSWRLDTFQLAGTLIGRAAEALVNPVFRATHALATMIAGKVEVGRRETRPGRPMTRRASSLASRLSFIPITISWIIAHLRANEGVL